MLLPAYYLAIFVWVRVSRVTSWAELFKRNWLNYWVVSLSLALPMVTAIILADHLVKQKILFAITRAVFLLLSIYIYPYVFLKHLGLRAIVLGAKFLTNNLKQSSPLILVTILTGEGERLGTDWIHSHFANNLSLTFGSAYVQDTLFFFVNVLVFNVACMMLHNKDYMDIEHVLSPIE